IEAGTNLSRDAVQTLNLEASEVRQRQHAPKLKIISFNEDDKQYELLALKHRYTFPLMLPAVAN
ncbi:hypothetical protein XENOCAPTIV_018537, partial [Xenoophorus captivus]